MSADVRFPMPAQQAARHEAGHALAAVVLGVPLHGLEIKGAPGFGFRGRTIHEKGASDWARVVIAHAGPMAEVAGPCAPVPKRADGLVYIPGRRDQEFIAAINAEWLHDLTPGSPLATARTLVLTHRRLLDDIARVVMEAPRHTVYAGRLYRRLPNLVDLIGTVTEPVTT